MNPQKNVALIECSDTAIPYKLDTISRLNGYQVKKVLVKTKTGQNIAKEDYPQSEIVQDRQSIFNDDTIELVIVNCPRNNDLDLVSEALEAGKQVRIL